MVELPPKDRGIRRSELHVLLKLYPVFRRYLKDRDKAKRDKETGYDPIRERNGILAVKAFIDLGPTFIKLGQILSARSDLLPKEYMKAFESLQDKVPAAPFSDAQKIIERSLGKPVDEIFEEFDREAISGASLGQVYRARYRGSDVAVKVNRPNVKEIVRRDLIVINRLLRLAKNRMESFLYTSIKNVIDDFSLRVYEEMDYVKERENLKRIWGNLSARNERVLVPNVFDEISTSEVLVMQYVSGTKITDIDSLKQKNYDLKNLAFRVDLLFLKMLLRDDIFHADPHPGNISLADDGNIILYDFGMVGSLDSDTRYSLLELYAGLVQTDPDMIIDSLLAMHALSPAANRGIIRRSMELVIAGMSGKRVEDREVREIFEIANDVIFEFPFKLPQALVLYMRMSSILEGVCLQLDPEFRFISVLRELLYNEGLLNEFYSRQLREFGKKAIISIEKGLDVLPALKRRLDETEGVAEMKRSKSIEISIFLGFGLLALVYFFHYDPLISEILIPVDLAIFVYSLIRK